MSAAEARSLCVRTEGPTGSSRPAALAQVAPDHVASYGITPDALTVYVNGAPVLVIDRARPEFPSRDCWAGL